MEGSGALPSKKWHCRALALTVRTFVLLIPASCCPWGAVLNTCALHILGMVITPGPTLRQAINKYSSQPSPITHSIPCTPAVARVSVEQPPAPGWPGGTSCFPLPAGWDAQSPRGDRASHRLSQRHQQISSSIFQADPLPPPLQLHSTYKNLRELGRTGRI